MHKSFNDMNKERKQYILDFVRKVANSEQIGGDTRKELHAICDEVGVAFRDTVCDNCCRDAAVQVYMLLKPKGTKRVCVMKNERDNYVWSVSGKAHIYAATLTDEFARELLAKGIIKADFFAVLPPTEEEEAETARKEAEEEEAARKAYEAEQARKAYEAEQARLNEEALKVEWVETPQEDNTAETVG